MYEILDNEKNCDIFSPKEYIIKIVFIYFANLI